MCQKYIWPRDCSPNTFLIITGVSVSVFLRFTWNLVQTWFPFLHPFWKLQKEHHYSLHEPSILIYTKYLYCHLVLHHTTPTGLGIAVLVQKISNYTSTVMRYIEPFFSRRIVSKNLGVTIVVRFTIAILWMYVRTITQPNTKWIHSLHVVPHHVADYSSLSRHLCSVQILFYSNTIWSVFLFSCSFPLFPWIF